jgi:YebC/PmpR family DNA-binding regulatory protein
MSGHSKWAQIKRQKGAADVKRGQVFTKLGREISVAAREGGPNPDTNARLRLVIQRAKEANMPHDTIERSIKRGAGPGDGAALEEIQYEGYGPNGAAILVQAMTENRNRTAAEVRAAFTRAGGSLGETGSVAWQFEPRGVIEVPANGADPEEVALKAIDAGAEDFQVVDGTVEVYTAPADLDQVRRALEEQRLHPSAFELSMVPKTTVELNPEDTAAVMRLIEKLEDLDDVQKVYSNLDISEAAVAAYEQAR